MAGNRRIVDAGRLWTGGLMAGVVAAGVAVVGLLIARGILDVQVLVREDGKLVNANTWWYAGVAFLAAIAATGLLHLLLLSAPQPYRFFGWIVGLTVAIAALLSELRRREPGEELRVHRRAAGWYEERACRRRPSRTRSPARTP